MNKQIHASKELQLLKSIEIESIYGFKADAFCFDQVQLEIFPVDKSQAVLIFNEDQGEFREVVQILETVCPYFKEQWKHWFDMTLTRPFKPDRHCLWPNKDLFSP